MVLTGSSEASGEVQDGAWWLEHRDGKGKKRCWLSQGKWRVRKGALTSLWPWRVTQQAADPQTYAFNLGSEAPSRGCLSCTLGLASLWARAVPQLTAAQLHLRARVPLVKPDYLRGNEKATDDSQIWRAWADGWMVVMLFAHRGNTGRKEALKENMILPWKCWHVQLELHIWSFNRED